MSHRTTKLRVVIPAYNAGRYLPSTLQSVVDAVSYAKRRGADFVPEVVLVDDASTDFTPRVLDAFVRQFPYATALRHGDNRGAAAARNTGSTHGRRPDLLAYLDADDLYDRRHLYLCLSYLGRHTEYDSIQSGLRIEAIDDVHPSWANRISAVSMITKCFRFSVFDEIGGFPEDDLFRREAEDVYFSALMRRFFRCARFAEETAIYRQRPGNLLSREREMLTRPPPADEREEVTLFPSMTRVRERVEARAQIMEERRAQRV